MFEKHIAVAAAAAREITSSRLLATSCWL